LAAFVFPLFGGFARRFCGRRFVGFGGLTVHGLADLRHVLFDDAFDGCAQITDKVKSIGNLHCLRSTLRRRFGVCSGTITTDHFNVRMLLQPSGQGLG
jgi:hypothetical protein